MARPPALSKPSNNATTRSRRRTSGNKILFKRKLVKKWLRNGGRKHAITMRAFSTVTNMGQLIFNKLVATVVNELTRHVRNLKTTIRTRHFIHAANLLGMSAELVESAIDMKKAKRYDVSAYKRSAVRRALAQYCPNHRCSTQALEFLWCLVILHLEEIIHYNTDLAKSEASVRIKEENIFNAIHCHSDGALDSMNHFVGSGISLSSCNV